MAIVCTGAAIGAFVDLYPGKEGYIHISQLEEHRVERVEDVVSVGDPILVLVTEIDGQSRITLSRKAALAKFAEEGRAADIEHDDAYPIYSRLG